MTAKPKPENTNVTRKDDNQQEVVNQNEVNQRQNAGHDLSVVAV